MNLLLDTHVVIWFITDYKKLPQKIKSIIENIDNSVFISLASLWELAIKHSLKKLKLKSELKEIFQLIQDSGIELLPISPEHILENSRLPFHHRDPPWRVRYGGLWKSQKNEVSLEFSTAGFGMACQMLDYTNYFIAFPLYISKMICYNLIISQAFSGIFYQDINIIL